MTHVKLNSKLLSYLFKRAEEFKDKYESKMLTVNHIFAAALEYVSEADNLKDSSKYDDAQEAKALFDMMKPYKFTADSVSATCEMLCCAKVSFFDDILFKQILVSSQQISETKGKKCIPADIFVKCIIDSPSLEVKNVINTKKDISPELDTIGDFEKLFDELFSGLELEKKEKTAEEKNEPSSEKSADKDPKELIKRITKETKALQKKLSNVVFGQDNAISIVAAGYFQSQLRQITDKDSRKPKATYLFAGPPGVGKTFLAEQSAEMLGLPFKRFDMSEYYDRESVMELIGTNKSFKGDKEGALTGFVNENPECVILFDEIEKAHIAIIHLFLQVLDAGRLRDNNMSKEVDFSKAVMIFTTNAGRKIYEESLTPNLSGISRKTILKALEKDVDPKTGTGSFPAAICSRFATGNVVMFNHMEAHSLRKIAEKEIRENLMRLEEETGIKCSIEDDVFSCILFSEGGHADARTVKSRANSFFSGELYELFRLISNGDSTASMDNIENINITLELPEDKDVLRLFRDDSKGYILSFADESKCATINAVADKKGFISKVVSDFDEAKDIINKHDVDLIICDLSCGRTESDSKELNIEDVDSKGREFFRYVSESADVPVFVLGDGENVYSEEELFSLLRDGARGVIDLSSADELSATVDEVMIQLHQQKSMLDLAKASKLVSYETSQTVSEDGKTAEIKLFDLSLSTAVDAEDAANILSDVSKPNVLFSDIIGAESAKSELEFFVNYLRNPKSFASKGLGVPKGVLFYGPPGTGKTMLAKAVAGESNVTFINAEGNHFLKKYRGEGEDAIRNLFATARKYAPTIIFIDEIDAIAKERKGDEHAPESVLNAFLAEMDGFKNDVKKPVFVLAATNFEVRPGTPKSLDQAFLRRFDRHIYIDMPDKNARLEYINMKIKGKPIFDISAEETENIAIRSAGMSLAQLANVFEYSMRIAVRNNKDKVDDAVFEEAFESFNYGEEKKWDISELEKTAYHEAGHAFLCWNTGEVPSYLTVVARGNHGGYMLHGDVESHGTYTKKMLIDRIRTALGGRASELVFFGDSDGLNTGASGDLKIATALAKSMVCSYGMDDDIGLAVVDENELIYNGALAKEIRDAVNGILKSELDYAMSVLRENQTAIKKIVEELLVKNHLSSNEIDSIFSSYAVKKA